MTKDKEEAQIAWTQLKDEDHFVRQIERHEEWVRLFFLEGSCNPNANTVVNVDLDVEKKEQSVSTFGLENSDDSELSPEWKI